MAKRFQFRLEPVLRVRKARRDEQRRMVAQHARALQLHREAIAELEGRVSATLTQARQTRVGAVIDVGLELQEQRWRLGLRRRIHMAMQQMNESTVSLANAREELARRTRDVKAVEKLRERRWNAHRLAEERTERRDADETAAQMYIRRAGGTSTSGAAMQA